MKNILRLLFVFLAGFPVFLPELSAHPFSAGEHPSFSADSVSGSNSSRNVSAPIYFRVGKSVIDPSFMGNRERMDQFVGTLRGILSNPDYVISKVRVVGMASPEGSRDRNLELAGSRARALADYLLRETGISEDKLEIVNGGENWSGLFAMIESSEDMPDKAKMLEFREQYREEWDALKRAMQYYNGSRAWKYMYQHFFPVLRTGAGGADSGRKLTELSKGNWARMRSLIESSDLPAARKQALLSVLDKAEIDRQTDAHTIMKELRRLGGDAFYTQMQNTAVETMLRESNVVSVDNWSLLREKIASSDIEDKAAVLSIIDNVPATGGREQKLRELNGGSTYRQIESLYPDLLTSRRAAKVSGATLADANWLMLRERIARSNMADKQDVLAIIDNEPDVKVREQRLRALNGGRTYAQLMEQALPSLLSGDAVGSREQQVANWSLLREQVVSSNLPDKQAVLDIFDMESDPSVRASKLQSLNGGATYKSIVTDLAPQLLTSGKRVGGTPAMASTTTVSAENWRVLRNMIAESDMPDKDRVLAIIDTESDPAVRERKLRELNDGYTDRYIKEVFFPELLYGISPAAKENWNLLEETVAESDMANKAQVLAIMKSIPAGAEREEAIRKLDNGKTWNALTQQAFTELLQNTEEVEASGTGMSFTFEASPAAKARAAELQRQQEEKRRQEEAARQAEERRLEEERQAEERRRQEEERRIAEEKAREAARLAAIEHRRMEPVVALKTDFVLWGSLMPGFEMGSFTPNLSAEAFFARRWSVQLGGAYSNWDALSGDYGLYAVTAVDVEPRWWLNNDGLFRGFFLGVYGTYGDFDLQKKNNPTGTTGTYFMGGLSGGWSQVLGRHLFLEAGLRLGYRSANGEHYTLLNGHNYTDGKETLGKFSPQVRIQLVYRFGKSGKSVK